MEISEDNKDAISSYRGNDVLAKRYYIARESFRPTGVSYHANYPRQPAFYNPRIVPTNRYFITRESLLRNTCIFVEELRAAILADAVPDRLAHLSHIFVVLLGGRNDLHAGIRQGDVITRIGNEAIVDLNSYLRALYSTEEAPVFEYVRAGEILTGSIAAND